MLGEGEQVSVGLALANVASGVTLSPMSSVTLTNEELSAEITVSASAMASGGNLMASASVMNATIPDAAIPVAIAPRQLALVFNPMSVALDPESADTVVEISLGGDDIGLLGEDESVVVTLTPDADSMTVDPTTLTLRGSIASTVRIQVSADMMSRTLTATAAALTNVDIADATLPVTIRERQFALIFRDPAVTTEQGDSQQINQAMLRADQPTQVLLSLEGSHLLDGEFVTATLTANESVTVTLPADAGEDDEIVFSASRTSAIVTITVSPDAIDAYVEALFDTTDVGTPIPSNANFAGTRLDIEVLALALMFDRAAVELTVDEETQVELSLIDVEGSALARETTITVQLSTLEGVLVSPETVILSGENPSTNLSLTALFNAVEGVLTATVLAGAGDVAIRGDELSVGVTPREFELVFRSVSDTARETAPLTTVNILAAGTTQVLLSLEGAEFADGEEVTVRITSADGLIAPIDSTAVLLSATQTMVVVELNAAFNAVNTPVTATIDPNDYEPFESSILPLNANFAMATVDAMIAPRAFTWVFDPSTELRVLAGDSAVVRLTLQAVEGSILGESMLGEGEQVSVGLALANVASGVTLSPMSSVTLTREELSAEITVSASAMASGGNLMASASVMNASIPNAAIAVVIARRQLALVFNPMSVALDPESADTVVEISLGGDDIGLLGEDESVTVTLTADSDGVTIEPSTLTLRGLIASTVRIQVSVDMMSRTLTATAAALTNANIADATLPVTVAERQFALIFRDPAMTTEQGDPQQINQAVLRAEQPTQVLLSLEGSRLLNGESVTVTLTADDSVTVTVTADASETDEIREIVFSAARTSAIVTITVSPDAIDAYVQASFDTTNVDMPIPPNASFADVRLDIEVRQLALIFDRSAIELTIDEETQIELSLIDVEGSALARETTITVQLSTLEGVLVSPETVILSGENPSTQLSLTALFNAVEGVLTATVSAGAGDVAIRGDELSVGVTPREFELVFRSVSDTAREAAPLTTVDILAAGTAQVLLSLEGAAFAEGEEVTVRVTSADGLIAPADSTAVLLSATQTMVVVELNAAFNAVNTPVTAAIDTNDYVPDGSSILPPNANFAMATVGAVITPRTFTWVFEPPTVRVLAGDSAMVSLTLQAEEGSMLGEGEQVSVDLTLTDTASGITLDPTPPVILTSEALSAEITVNASVMASSGNLMASASVMNATIPDAAIPVVIAPRQLALVFNPASVELIPANAEDTPVEISLGGDDFSLLGENESVTVTLTLEAEGVSIVDDELTFMLSGSAATQIVRLRASVGAESGTLTARIDPSANPQLPPGTNLAGLEASLAIQVRGGIRLRVKMFLEGPLQ